MIVCLCKAVGHREIEALIARGLRSVRDLGRACGAGTDCGSCVCELRAQLRRAGSVHEREPQPVAAK